LNFSAQYQQAPVPPGGNVIKRDWLRSYTTAPARFDRVIISWDTASTLSETRDWSVGTVWGAVGLDFYLLEVFRERLESPNLRQAIIRLHHQHHAAATLIERPNSAGLWRRTSTRPAICVRSPCARKGTNWRGSWRKRRVSRPDKCICQKMRHGSQPI
jgi:phage terminase large subunit-like protein